MSYFERDRYPYLARLDDKVGDLLSSPQAKDWDTDTKEQNICNVHPVYWMEEYGHIKAAKADDSGEVKIIPFKLNPTQLQIANKICKHLTETPWSRVQMIVLKNRKAGTSTLTAAFDYWFMRRLRNCGVFLIADLKSHTANIFEMVQLFHRKDRCKGRPKKVSMPHGKTGLKLDNGSLLEIDSGENSNPGTSGTIQICHMSENSKWRDPLSAETSLINSMAREGFIFLMKESTAYGLNKFAQDWESASQPNSQWEDVFVFWPDLPDCEEPVLPEEVVSYTEEEEELVAAYNLRIGHVKFRRTQIDKLQSVDQFKQDFPLNRQEPFLVTGTYFFDNEAIQQRIIDIRFYYDWKKRGWQYVEEKYRDKIVSMKRHPRGIVAAQHVMETECVVPEVVTFSANAGRVTWARKPEGNLDTGCALMFRAPRKDGEYLITVDVAEGIQSDEYTSDHSVIQVFDAHRREQVLEWGGVYDEEVTALYATLIARVYNKALVVPEMCNRCGGTLEAELKKTGYRKFYYQQVIRNQQVDRKFGWETKNSNKRNVCTRLKLDFKNKDVLIHSLNALEEMLWFTDRNGKLGAAQGKRDDRVMSLAVGCEVIFNTTAYHEPQGKKKRATEPQIYRTSVFPSQHRRDSLAAVRRYM